MATANRAVPQRVAGQALRCIALDDTIAAVGYGRSERAASASFGLSGPQAPAILQALFVGGAPGRPSRVCFQSHRLYYGRIVDPRSGECADEVLASTMRAPRTYTREDVAEINCHGGPPGFAEGFSASVWRKGRGRRTQVSLPCAPSSTGVSI